MRAVKLFDDHIGFLKANLHTHTTGSDGRATPEESMRRYRAAGYDVLALTDHRKVTAVDPALVPEGLVLVPGVELDFLLSNQAVHIVGLDVRPEIAEKWNRQGTPQQAVEAIRDCGGEAILAHPAWSLNTPEMIASLEHIIGTEIWNSVSTLPVNPIRPDSSSLLDVTAATYGRLLPLMASDDTHAYGAEFAVGATMIQARERTVSGVMEALREGRFYATLGPRFRQVSYEDGVVHVSCSPVESVVFYSALPWASGRAVCVSGQTECDYRVHPNERFVRVQIIDSEGKSAWCSPFAV